MRHVKIIHPFKGHKVGQIVCLEDEQAEWLISRKYAEPVESLAEAATPPRSVSSKASSRSSKGK